MRRNETYYIIFEDFDTRILPCSCDDGCCGDCFKSFTKARNEAIRYLKDLIANCKARIEELRTETAW
jgi:hypothetical protein